MKFGFARYNRYVKSDLRDVVEPFERASREVRREAARLEALVGRDNTPTVGAYREAFIRQTIRSYLPEGLEAGSGFVLSPDGERSRQMDVVVYESGPEPPAFAEEGFVVAEAERVRAVVEVKSRIARGSFRQAVGELSRVKSWVPLESHAPPIYAALVAFSSPSPEALMRAAQEHYQGRLEAPGPPGAPYGYKWRVVDLVAVLGRWSLVAGLLPWPSADSPGADLDIPAVASLLAAGSGGADASLHLLVTGLLAHLNDFAGHPCPKPLISSYRPLAHAFGQPAVALLGALEGVEPSFLKRHDEVFEDQGLSLDVERRLIVKS